MEAPRRNFTRQPRKQSESEQSRSAVADHAVQNNHVINWRQDAKKSFVRSVITGHVLSEKLFGSEREHLTLWTETRGPTIYPIFMIHFWRHQLPRGHHLVAIIGNKVGSTKSILMKCSVPEHETVNRKSIFWFWQMNLLILRGHNWMLLAHRP